jgi:hypothetical protein
MNVQWATFWAIVATLLAIVWQAKATADSAAAALLNVRQADEHFRLVHQQWLKLTRWRSDFHHTTHPSGKPSLGILFAIANQTPMHVTLKKITVRIAVIGNRETMNDPDCLVSSQLDHVLPPERDYGTLTPFVMLDTDERLNAYHASTLRAIFHIEVKFVDAFEMDRTQNFGVTGWFARDQPARFD